jgi:ubiquinone/menaquinone biosynthesis C-methylase UbiE
MGSITWDREWVQAYDVIYSAGFEPAVLDPMVDLRAELAQGGAALEFAVGTGRVALALSARGVPVQGIELSPDMVQQMRAKPGADAVPVTIGDMTSMRVAACFQVVYLVANTIIERHDSGGTVRHSAPYRYVWPSELV